MGAVLEIPDYHGPYAGTFVPTLVAVGRAVRERLGLDYHCAFPKEVAGRQWLELLEAEGIGVTLLDKEAPLRSRLARIRALAERVDARVIRSHFTAWDMEAAIAGRAAGAAVVWHVHTGNLDYGWRGHARDLVKARTMGRLAADLVIAVSDEIAVDLSRRGFPRAKVRTVLNGIDVDRYALGSDRAAARAAFGLPGSGDVVLTLGWTPRRKGTDVVVRAMEGSEAALLLVGGDELRATLPDPLPPWLHVVAPVPDAARLYAAADVFVSASREEAFSYAIGEAMAAGLPVVSSDIPGPSAYFDAPGVWRYPVEDVGALRAAIESALASDRAGLGRGNREFVGARLGLERHVDSVVDVLTQALEARGRAADDLA